MTSPPSSWFEVEGNGSGGRTSTATDPLMVPEGLWKEGAFVDPLPSKVGKGNEEKRLRDGGDAPGGNDDIHAIMMESGFFPQGGKGPQISSVFYFITSWIFFVQGMSGMSGLAVSYFYKDTLGVDPATLSTVTSLTALPWTIKPLYGFMSDGWPIMGYRRKPYIIIAGAVVRKKMITTIKSLHLAVPVSKLYLM